MAAGGGREIPPGTGGAPETHERSVCNSAFFGRESDNAHVKKKPTKKRGENLKRIPMTIRVLEAWVKKYRIETLLISPTRVETCAMHRGRRVKKNISHCIHIQRSARPAFVA